MQNHLVSTIIALTLAGLLLVLVGSIPERRSGLPCRDCNVVLISMDTLGAKHTSVYDETLDTTPFLAELAEEGAVVFEEAFVQAPWTLPSHTAMLTGKYPWEVGMNSANDLLPEQLDTIAELLQKEGYATAAFSNGAFVQPAWNFDQGFDTFVGRATEDHWNDLPTLAEEAGAWARDAARSAKPFFLFVRPFHVHDPYGPEGEDQIGIEEIVAANTRPGGPTEEEARRFERAYRAEVREADAALKALYETLAETGELNRTLFIVTADHGEEFGEHGTVAYHSVTTYREVLRVPLIISAPGLPKARVPYTVEVRSVPATILDLLGKPVPEGTAASLVPLALGEERGDHRALARTIQERAHNLSIIVEAYKNIGRYEDETVSARESTGAPEHPLTYSAIEGRWHAIREKDGRIMLFDMQTDPNEHNDRAAAAPQSLGGTPAQLMEAVRTAKP